MKTGTASDFWNCYEEDFRRCRNSVERVPARHRVEPRPARAAQRAGEPPAFDDAALDHYAKMFAACRNHGMEPVVTLHHFVHPAWLGTDPWLKPETPGLFAAYVKHAVSHVNQKLTGEHRVVPLKYFITINEPNMLVLNTYLGNQFPAKGSSASER